MLSCELMDAQNMVAECRKMCCNCSHEVIKAIRRVDSLVHDNVQRICVLHECNAGTSAQDSFAVHRKQPKQELHIRPRLRWLLTPIAAYVL